MSSERDLAAIGLSILTQARRNEAVGPSRAIANQVLAPRLGIGPHTKVGGPAVRSRLAGRFSTPHQSQHSYEGEDAGQEALFSCSAMKDSEVMPPSSPAQRRLGRGERRSNGHDAPTRRLPQASTEPRGRGPAVGPSPRQNA